MHKIERILVVVLSIALACFLLFPTLKWYSYTTETDRIIAASGLSAIRDISHKNALDDVKELKELVRGTKTEEATTSDETIVDETITDETADGSTVLDETVPNESATNEVVTDEVATDEVVVDDIDLSATHKHQTAAAREEYNNKNKPLPNKWTAKAILDAFDTEAEAVSAFEKYYRDKYLSLQKTSAKALKLGLDLRGGMSVLLQGDIETLTERLGHSPTTEEIDAAFTQDIEILRMRVDQYGVSEVDIRRQGNDQILVEVPGEADPEKVQSLIRGQGTLQFAIVEEAKSEELRKWADEHYSEMFDENGSFVAPDWIEEGYSAHAYYRNDEYGLETIVTSYPCAVIDDSQTMDGRYIRSASVSRDPQTRQPIVTFELTSEGGDLFYNLTSSNIRKPMAVVMDGKIKSIATIQSGIRTNVQVSGFTEQEAEDLKVVLEATTFPIELSIVSEERVGASLGEDSINLAIKALIVGLSLIVLFLLIYYKLPGFLAVLMLALDMFLIVSVLSAFGFTLTLTSIAGLILTLGMAVDSAVIIFERIREEVETGKDVKTAIRTAFSRARWTLIDANITTMIAAIVLSFLGSSAVKGFANTLAIGIVCSLLTMFFMLHLFMDLFITDVKHPRLLMGRIKVLDEEALNKKNSRRLGVVKASWIALVLSSVLAIAGAGFLIKESGFALGIDFESGYMATVRIEQSNRDAIRIDEVRSALDNGFSVQNSGDNDNGMFIIKAGADDEKERETVASSMREQLNAYFGEGNVEIVSENFIGAKFSSSLIKGSLIGIAVSLVLMLIYIWIRFRLSFALASVLSLMHDVLLLLAFISIARIEISSVTIAAILTIIGYSINNTIVIFDRVRENIMLSSGKGDLNVIIERSVAQSLKRTLFSSSTTIVAVLPVAIFVTSEIKMFALCLVVGMLIGIYSANFVAPNILRLFSKIKNPAFDPMAIKLKVKE